MSQTESIVSISSYVGAVRRRLTIIVGLTLVGAFIGAAAAFLQGGSYVSEAQVQVRPIISRSSDPDLDVTRQVDIASEAEVASSQRVAEWAVAIDGANFAAANDFESRAAGIEQVREQVLTGGVSVDDSAAVLADLQVVAEGEANVLVFSSSADSPERAQQVAQSAAVAYLEFRADQVRQERLSARERLAVREETLTGEVDTLASERISRQTKTRADTGDPTLTIEPSAAEITKSEELTEIGRTYAELEVSVVDPGVVLSDAVLPTQTDGLPLPAGLIMGGLLGLIAALSVAYVLDQQDDRIRSASKELSALGAQVLGSVPVDRKKFGLPAPVDTLSEANNKANDAYRRLHGSVSFALDNADKSVILIAGVSGQYAAGLVAANLAITAARAGRRTLLVGADLRQGFMPNYLGQRRSQGLTDVIMGGAQLKDVLIDVPTVENLSFLSGGSETARPDTVMQSEGIGRLVLALQAAYDLVLIEVPPILNAADAVEIARVCEGALVVVDSDTESRQSIAEAIAQLRNVGLSVDGVVVADK